VGENRIQISIEAQNQAHAAIGQVALDIQRLNTEIKNLRAASLQGVDVAQRLGEAYAKKAQAARALRDAQSILVPKQNELTLSMKALESSMRAATQAMAAHAGIVGQVVASAGALLNPIGLVTVALTASGLAAVAAANKIGDYQESVDLAADRTGLSAREIGGLRVAASNVGRDFESIQPQLDRFTRLLGEARSGSVEAVKTFIALGRVIGSDLTDPAKSTGVVLKEVAGALQALPDAAERARLSFELFGRGGLSMQAILSQDLTAAEALAERLGITLSPAMQKVARDADIAGDKLKLSFMGAINTLLTSLAPAGTAIINWMTGLTNSILGITEASEKTSTQKAWDELDRLRSMALDTSEALRQVKLVPGTGEGLEAGPSLTGAIGITRQERATSATMGLRIGSEVIAASAATRQVTEAQKLLAKEAKELAEAYRKAHPFLGPPSAEFFMQEPERELAFRPILRPMQGGDLTMPRIDFTEAEKASKAYADALADATNGQYQATEAIGDFSATVEEVFAGAISSAVGSFVNNVLSGVQSIGSAFAAMIQRIFTEIASALATQAVLSFLSPVPVKAQSGLIVTGTRGMDTVPILAGRGEAILSHTLTDKLDRFITSVSSAMSPTLMQPATAGPNVVYSEGAFTFHINAPLGDPLAIRDAINEQVLPEIYRSQARGAHRRFGD